MRRYRQVAFSTHTIGIWAVVDPYEAHGGSPCRVCASTPRSRSLCTASLWRGAAGRGVRANLETRTVPLHIASVAARPCN